MKSKKESKNPKKNHGIRKKSLRNPKESIRIQKKSRNPPLYQLIYTGKSIV